MNSSQQQARAILTQVPRLMHWIRLEMRKAVTQDLTVPQYRILANLSQGMRTSSELGEWIGVTLPAMSRMVDALVRKGLVRRESNPSDRRQIRLLLTPQGRALFDRTRRRVEKQLILRIKKMGDDHTLRLGEGLQSLAVLQEALF